MPYPSRGCGTCRSRRIKCDGKRPACIQCTKSSRQCSGYEADSGGLPFRSENEFAAGTARRPRDGRHTTKFASQSRSPKQSPSKSSPEPKSRLGSLGAQLSIESPSPDIRPEHLPLVRSLNAPIESQAVIYFIKGWVQPDTLVGSVQDDVARSLHTATAMHSTLSLAIIAVSLAVFGKTKRSEVALTSSREKYTQALGLAKQSMGDTREALSDETLMSVMMLTSYENTVCDAKAQDTLFWRSVHHLKGAIAILSLRKSLNPLTERSIRLDRNVRRQVIRNSLTHGFTLPAYLHDGTEFGEDGIDLTFDAFTVRLSQLRISGIPLWTELMKSASINDLDTQRLRASVSSIIAEAWKLDSDLAAWAASIPLEWSYVAQDLEPGASSAAGVENATLFYGTTVHVYLNLPNATAWNRYRGARVATNSIVARVMQHLRSRPHILPSSIVEEQYQLAVSNACTLVNDICASVPFVFGCVRLPQDTSSTATEVVRGAAPASETSARTAFLLSWPIVISAAALELPDGQRTWLQEKLSLVARITGNGRLAAAANFSHMDMSPHYNLPALSQRVMKADF